MKKVFLSAILVASLSSTALFAADASKESVMALLNKTGVSKVIETMFANMEKMISGDQKEKKEFNDFVKELDINDYLNRIIPIYQKYFTQEDIDAMNKFYDTPTGKKTIQILPKMSAESMQIGQQWAMEAIKKLEQKNKK